MDGQDLVVIAYIYISHSSCSYADGCSRPGGNCIYISHSSCSSADGCSRPEMTSKSVMSWPAVANCHGSKTQIALWYA